MHLEAITACVNYSDFLSLTLPINKDKFDFFLVVTTPDDKATQKVCKDNNVEYITTTKFYDNGAKFDRGKAISWAFQYLGYKEWVIHMDSDIILADTIRSDLNQENLNINTLYGVGRTFIWTYQDWLDLKIGKKSIFDFKTVPGYGCGFFQLFNMQSSKISNIPLEFLYPSYSNVCESDIGFLKRWHPDVREVGKLSFNVIHLGPHGIFHNGRETPKISSLQGKSFIEFDNVSQNILYKS